MQDILCGLAANPTLPAALVDELVRLALTGPDRELADDLADRTDLTRAQVLALAAHDGATAASLARLGWLTAEDVDPAALPDAALALLDRQAGRPEWAQLLAADPDADRRERLAACPGLPPATARALAADPEIGVVAELALWTADPELAARLAGHPHAEVRLRTAANEAVPPPVLAALLTGRGLPEARWCGVCEREPVPWVHPPDCPRPACDLPPDAACSGDHESTLHAIRQVALQNPAVPAEAAATFADAPSALLRVALADRADLPPAVQPRLARDTVPMVRSALAANPATGEAVLRTLAEDRGHGVQRALLDNPRLPLDLLVRLAPAVRTGPALLPRIAEASEAEIREMAASPQARVRMLAARRRDLPDDVRDALAADPDAAVVAAVASHPGLTETQLRTVVGRFGPSVAAGAAANPDAPPTLLADLARQQPPARKALRSIAEHPRATAVALLPCLADARARHLAAGHPALPPEALAALLTDDDWQVVRAAAANPSLPPGLMASLVAGATT
ncbi:hypothetical protein [Kitasatospora sp. KL5]|uniref:hypothetical protein n=1 Tax=Kitasatospora sp. KL5 TaxID=3425125 RepID=UPI003D6E7525